MHCYSGSVELANQYVKLGCYLSIAGPVTFKNANRLIEVAKSIPDDRILIETDAPYLTPEPHRGKRNEPAYVRYTAEKVAEIRGVTYEETAVLTTANAKRFFRIA
jgi:TatD DNase family protein